MGNLYWVANGDVKRVRASDGKVIETWTGMINPSSLLIANGRVYVTGNVAPGKLYAIDPDQPAGNAVLLTDVGDHPVGIAYDGERILTANSGGSITNYNVPSGSKITYTHNFPSPQDIVYDGSNFWVTDLTLGNVRKVLVTGQVGEETQIGTAVYGLTFDGTNLWVPGQDFAGSKVVVVRTATGAVVATLTGNGLNDPRAASFDGQRVLVSNASGSVSLWRAADLAPLGTFSTPAHPDAVCSDGINFWVTLPNIGKIARY